mgnify:CR=1 FL=1
MNATIISDVFVAAASGSLPFKRAVEIALRIATPYEIAEAIEHIPRGRDRTIIRCHVGHALWRRGLKLPDIPPRTSRGWPIVYLGAPRNQQPAATAPRPRPRS